MRSYRIELFCASLLCQCPSCQSSLAAPQGCCEPGAHCAAEICYCQDLASECGRTVAASWPRQAGSLHEYYQNRQTETFCGFAVHIQLTISCLRTALHARRLFAHTNIARNGVSHFLFTCFATEVVGG